MAVGNTLSQGPGFDRRTASSRPLIRFNESLLTERFLTGYGFIRKSRPGGELLANDRNVARGFDSKADRVSLDSQHRDDDVLGNPNFFATLARQYQH